MLTEVMSTMFVTGDPFTPGTIVGALATKTQLDRVSSYVDIAKNEGAHVITGGDAAATTDTSSPQPCSIQVTPDMRVVREEIGPDGVLMTFNDTEDAIAKANDTEYGLAASVWTTNLTTAHRMAAGIQAGTVWVNTWAEMSTGALPFGGYKQSGTGREGGLEGLDAYTQAKTVLIAL